MKPCHHTTPKDGCRVCHLFDTHPDYRRLWGGGDIPKLPVINVAVTADGIGDSLLGLLAVCGLQEQGKRVHYALLGTSRKGSPWQEQWVRLFHQDVSCSLVEGSPTYFPFETYSQQNRTRLAKPRVKHYCDTCGCSPVLPQVLPLPRGDLDWAEQYRGAVVLSPFSSWSCRTWLPGNWRLLQELLEREGRSVVVIDGRSPDARRTKIFTCPVLIDQPATRIAALMKVSSVVVSGDSGMMHLAGCLRVPGIVLCGPIRGENVYGCYPTIEVKHSSAPCIGCHWIGAHGWRPVCDQMCAALQMITPEQICNRICRRSLLSEDRLSVLRTSVQATAALPGVMAEVGVYKGGSARVIADTCPSKKLHLFDTFCGQPSDDLDGDHRKGDFADLDFEDVKRHLTGCNVEYHVGEFPATTEGLHEQFSFVHLDCDSYQCIKACLLYYWDRMVDNGMIVIDDFGWVRTPGVERAVREVLPDVGVERTASIQARIVRNRKASKKCCGGSKRRNLHVR